MFYKEDDYASNCKKCIIKEQLRIRVVKFWHDSKDKVIMGLYENI